MNKNMATSRKIKDKSVKTGKQQPEKMPFYKQINDSLNSNAISFITGAMLLTVSLYFIIAYFSFLFKGGADQSALASSMQEVANSSGRLGASVSEKIVNGWFGLTSILMPVFLIFCSINLMKIYHFKLLKQFISCAFLTVWGSVFLHFILSPVMSGSFILPGGCHGATIVELARVNIGIPGLMLILAFTMLLYCIFLTRRTIELIQGWGIGLKSSLSETIHSAKHSTESDDVEGQPGEEPGNAPVSGLQTPEPVADDIEKKPKKKKFSLLDSLMEYMSDNKPEATEESTDGATAAPIVTPAPMTEQEELAPAIIEAGTDDFTEPIPDDVAGTAETDETVIENVQEGTADTSSVDKEEKPAAKTAENIDMSIKVANDVEKAEGKLQEPYDPRLDLSHYKFPELSLLKHYDNIDLSVNEAEQNSNKQRIIQVLSNFGIGIDTINATVGPTITLYEITPAPGVRISKIRNLEADIALSLSALGIRIIAPIPGKGTIGIEVPNAHPAMVSMESILNSKKFAESKMELPVAIGKTITNDVYMFDLAKTPHLLVAGATGQGKSVGLNALLTSLLYKKHPAEMKLVMVDPKMVEFSIYAPIIRHFLAKLPDEEEAIITDTTKVIHTLKSLCIEMDTRYELLKNANVRSIIEYNNMFKERRLNPEKGHRFLPYIVVIIDEFGDLIMTAGKDIETPIARIAQKARAVGIHMVIATQRPTTNIITGTIKANFPARMAFRVSSMMDSRTILDRPGANQLIGRGDMLYLQGNDPERVQCAFVDTPEVNRICEYISKQQGYTDAYPLPEYVDENEGEGGTGSVDVGKFDALFTDAARLVVVSQSGSTSLIQRKFSIGYNRAGRIMDQLERAGVVGKADGSKPRAVLYADETALERLFESLNVF